MEREPASPQCTNGDTLALTPFRLAEKKYKLYLTDRRTARRQPLRETDFTDVVDFRYLDANTEHNRSHMRLVKTASDSRVQCFAFTAVPGLFVFPAAVPEGEQQALCQDAILRYGDSGRHPNHLSTHASNPRSTTRYEAPMRWATLGFSYQWSSKTYDKEHYSPFPHAVRKHIEKILLLIDSTSDLKDVMVAPYEPQTAIVNYFPVGSMMMAHQDVSEELTQQPLISISLGCSCVFLMGTSSRDDAPYAFWLRSGDVAIFSGPSRLAFHSIPRIMDDCPPYLCSVPDVNQSREEEEEEKQANNDLPTNMDRKDVKEDEAYWREQMRHMRININVRQVYSDSCEFLWES